MAIQFEFDFTDAHEEEPPQSADDTQANEPAVKPLTRRNLNRAVLAWVAAQDVSGLARQVPTRTSMFRTGIAAFWSTPVRNCAPVGPHKVMTPTMTMVVECRMTRDECWPDCSNSEELSPRLREYHERREQLHKQIRKEEPQLRRGDSLFEEYADWNYDDTANMEYHQLKQKIRKLEQFLYKGTRFEHIRKARISDYAYLAVPTGVVKPHELAEGWGLLWIDEMMNVETVVEAAYLDCLTENRLHLVQNIAIASRDSVLFKDGIRLKDDESQFMPVPKRRRKPRHPAES